MMNNPKQILLFCLVFLLQGCGYSNPYVNQSTGEDKGKKTSLYISMWKNQTGELGYQSVIRERLTYWLNKSPGWHLVQDPDQADYLVSGVIKSADFPGLSYDQYKNVNELRAEIRFGYEVRERRTGEIILTQTDPVKRETFSVNNSAAATEGAKKEALNDIADDIADEIYVRLFYEISRQNRKIPNN